MRRAKARLMVYRLGLGLGAGSARGLREGEYWDSEGECLDSDGEYWDSLRGPSEAEPVRPSPI